MGKLTNYHITVSGRVQGVGYRAFVCRAASSLRITGFVKNNVDGTVFIEAEGTESALMQLVSICKTGPGWAHVDKVLYTESPTGDYKEFRIKY